MTESRIRRASVRSGVAAIVLAAGIGAGFLPASDKVLASASLATPVTVSAMENCLVCFEWYCESGWHDAFDHEEWQEDRSRGGGAHMSGPCFEGSCDDNHPAGCEDTEGGEPLTDQNLETLRTGILASDVPLVSSVLRAHSNRLALNVKRSAIQLITCKGTVNMHMPLPKWMADAVSTALQPAQ